MGIATFIWAGLVTFWILSAAYLATIAVLVARRVRRDRARRSGASPAPRSR